MRSALNEMGHKVVQIMNVLNRETKEPKNLFFIDLERNSNNGEVYNIKTLLHAVVRFETPNKKQIIVQCKRCQNYGHTRNQYTQQFRCVKCAGAHDYRTCEKKMADGKLAKCALCEGAHPANYKGCQVYLDIVSKRFRNYNGTALRGRNPPAQQLGTDHTVRIPQGPNAMRAQTGTLTYAQATTQQLPCRNNNTQSYLPANDYSFATYLQQ